MLTSCCDVIWFIYTCVSVPQKVSVQLAVLNCASKPLSIFAMSGTSSAELLL